MRVQQAIVELLDSHSDALALTRRQLADLAGINAGQLSNWLRLAGALGASKEGRAAQVMLENVEAVLRRDPPSAHGGELTSLAQVLRSYGPRLRLLAADIDAAGAGQPVSPNNPLFVKRAAYSELEIRLKSELIQLAVTGGPKTGRSSLLLAAQEMLEPSCTVLSVDLAQYSPSTTDTEELEARFCHWLASCCEAQLDGPFRETFNRSTDAVRWVLHNVLPNSRGSHCVFLVDHIEALPLRHSDSTIESLEYRILESILFDWVNNRADEPALNKVGGVVAFDLNWAGFPFDETGRRSSLLLSRLDRLHIRNLSEHEVGSVIQALTPNRLDATSLRQLTWTECGGHAYTTQLFAKGLNNSAETARTQAKEGVEAIGRAALQRWPQWLRQNVAKEISRILTPAGEYEGSQEARKALLSSGLCVRKGPREHLATSRHPIRAVNPVHLQRFGEIIDPPVRSSETGSSQR